MNKGFIPIETELHEKLNFDNDLIIKCLFYIGKNIQDIFNFEKEMVEVFLTILTNFIGNNYPVIGLRVKTEYTHKIVLDFFEIEIKNWIENNGGIEKLVIISEKLETISWKNLQEFEEFLI